MLSILVFVIFCFCFVGPTLCFDVKKLSLIEIEVVFLPSACRVDFFIFLYHLFPLTFQFSNLLK